MTLFSWVAGEDGASSSSSAAAFSSAPSSLLFYGFLSLLCCCFDRFAQDPVQLFTELTFPLVKTLIKNLVSTRFPYLFGVEALRAWVKVRGLEEWH